FAQRIAAGIEELHQPLHLGAIFLMRTARKARREAHFHLRIEAARKRWIAANFNLAAPHLEKIQRALGKALGYFAFADRSIVRARNWRAFGIHRNAPRH